MARRRWQIGSIDYSNSLTLSGCISSIVNGELIGYKKRRIKRRKTWRKTHHGEENRPTIKGLEETFTGSQSGKMHQSPHQLEPLLLNERQLEIVASLSEGIVMRSVKLTSAAHETTRAALRELVRKMNSFYSNRIEGQNTHPRNIERALENDFSLKLGEARLQRIALAHIGAEKKWKHCAVAVRRQIYSDLVHVRRWIAGHAVRTLDLAENQ